MKYSIKRLKTPKGATKYELRLTVRKGADVKKRTLRFDTKAEAEAELQRIQVSAVEEMNKKAELQRMGLTEADMRTWDTELAYWVKHQQPKLAPGWRANTTTWAREVDPLLGGKLVYSQITPELIDSVVTFLKSPRPLIRDGKTVRTLPPNSDKTVWLKVGWVQSVLNFSVKKRRLKFSPIAEYEKTKPAEAEIDFWEKDETESFLAFADEKYKTDRRMIYVLYLTLINAALREAEAFALKPKCLKRSIKQLYITEQWNRVDKDFSVLKGRKARGVPLNDELLSELEGLIAASGAKSDDLIFTMNGHALDAHTLYNQFQRDISQWGGRKISVHGLRHTGATLMLLSGIDIRTVQRILGHTDVKTTERYLHLVHKNVTDAAERFSINRSKNGVKGPNASGQKTRGNHD